MLYNANKRIHKLYYNPIYVFSYLNLNHYIFFSYEIFKLYLTIKLLPATLFGSILCFAGYPIAAHPIILKSDGI